VAVWTPNQKLALLRLAERLRNVSEACKRLGFSRDSYYRLKRLYETRGKAGLESAPRRPPRPNRPVPPLMERAILAISRRNPCWGRLEVAGAAQATARDHISASGVYNVWRRHNLTTRKRRGCDDPIEPRPREARPETTAEEIRCPFCHKASGVPPFVCAKCGIAIPRKF